MKGGGGLGHIEQCSGLTPGCVQGFMWLHARQCLNSVTPDFVIFYLTWLKGTVLTGSFSNTLCQRKLETSVVFSK